MTSKVAAFAPIRTVLLPFGWPSDCDVVEFLQH